MTLSTILILLIFGVLAGFVNTVSAAGSLIAVPSLIFGGLPATDANATNRIGVLFQNMAAVYGFRSKGVRGDNYMWWLALAAIPGAILGALFAVKIDAFLLNKILAILMVVFIFITLFNPLKPTEKVTPRLDTRHKVAGFVSYFFIGIYGGFIQAGTGFFMMATGLLIHRFDIVKTNYYKAFIMFIYTIAALGIFLWKGNVHWAEGLLLAVGMSLGGWIGSRWSVDASEERIKWLMIVVLAVFSVKLWFYS
jgi:hypothetical protein